MKTNIKHVLIIFALAITFLSCSKKDDNNAPATTGLDYTVDCQFTIGTTSYYGKASYLNIPIGSAPDGCEKSSFQIIANNDPDILITISSLRQEGGAFDSPNGNAASTCNKMGMRTACKLSGQPFQYYVSNIASNNVVSLSGKTYSLTCKVYYDNANLSSVNTTVTATWTKP